MPRSRSAIAACSLLLATAALAGCSAGRSYAVRGFSLVREPGDNPFPTRRQLKELTDEPAPKLSNEHPAVDVERWELAGPFPAGIGDQPLKDPTRWESALITVTKGQLQLTDGMRCVAREAGRFYAQYDGPPPLDLAQFIIGRCGAPIATFHVIGESYTGSFTEEELFDRERPSLAQRIDLHGATFVAGVVYIRKGDRHTIAAALAQPTIALAPVTRESTGESVTLRGSVSHDVAHVFAYASGSDLRPQECTCDAYGKTITVTCPVTADRDHTWIEIATQRPEQILFEPVVHLMVSATGHSSNVYTRPDIALNLKKTDEVIAALNAARTDSDLPPVERDDGQTDVFARVVPHYIAAASAGNQRRVERLAMGLAAGWDVDGEVRYGALAAGFRQGGARADRLIASRLSSPLAASILLDPLVTRVAVGTFETEGMTATVIGTYTLLAANEPHDARRDAVWKAVTAQRERAGKKPPKPIKRLDSRTEAARSRLENSPISPKSALMSYMKDAARTLHSSIVGFSMEVDRLENFRLPKFLVEWPDLRMDVAVARYQHPGDPWTRYAVLVVAPGETTEDAVPSGASGMSPEYEMLAP